VSKKIRVLVVDDSAVMRELLTEIISADPEMEVVGGAADPYIAREKIKLLNPDVITLDIEMPRMDGLAFLSNLMRLRPMPVVMCSSLTQRGADIVLDALDLGAVDYIAKPIVNEVHGLREAAQEIVAKVKSAAGAQVRRLVDAPVIKVEENYSADVVLPKRKPLSVQSAERIIAIGASTGGTEAIKEVLARLPSSAPGIVVVQHIPKAFSTAFAARMNALCELEVCEATDGLPILAGHAYIAPGDQHLLVARAGPRYICRLSDAAPVNRHKPSVDVLFRSVAQAAAEKGVGVILTGMGKDGAIGMKEMREAGAATLAQDEHSSVVWGMPGAAWEIGAAQTLHPVTTIAAQVLAHLSGRTNGQKSIQSA
jgi:two-component system, chemotaxis family, protein-glutamate methylesterase/glutaminase